MQGIGKHSGSHTSFLSTTRLPIENDKKHPFCLSGLFVKWELKIFISRTRTQKHNLKTSNNVSRQYIDRSLRVSPDSISCTPDNNADSSLGYQGYGALWAWWLCVSKNTIYQLCWSLISLSRTMFLSLMRPVLKPELIARLRGHKVCCNNGGRWLAEMGCIEPLIGHGVTINILIGRVTGPSLELGDSTSEISFYRKWIITRWWETSVERRDREQISRSEQLLVCADPLSQARKLAHREINLI